MIPRIKCFIFSLCICSSASAASADVISERSDTSKTLASCGDGVCNGYEDQFSCDVDCGGKEFNACAFVFSGIERDPAFYSHHKYGTPCQQVKTVCGDNPEFLMSVSCTFYAEFCKDTEITCE